VVIAGGKKLPELDVFKMAYQAVEGVSGVNLTPMPKKDTTTVVCVADFRAKEGKTDQLIAALHALMEPTHKEPGCVRYELNQRVDDPRWITFIEKWKDKKVFDEHCAKPYLTNYSDNVRPGLVEAFEVKLYEEILP